MTSIPLEEIIVIGQSILGAKRHIMAFDFLWSWDCALTFGDEVNYVWKGSKSWVFVLYLLNRYCALPYVVWILSIIASWWSGGSRKACEWTVFLETPHFNFATLFVQATLTLQVHIVAEKNKLFTAALGCVTLTNFFFGCYVGVQVFTLGASVWPVADIDPFRLCFSNEPAVHQVIIVSFSLVYDFLALLMVVWVDCKSGDFRSPSFTTVFGGVVNESTVYFFVIFTSHLLVEFLVLFAPKTYRYLPANSNVIFISMMTTRLVLSLRKAAGQPPSLTCTEDLDAVTGTVFAGVHTTMEDEGTEVEVSSA